MSKQWWKAAALRAVKTVAQTAIATVGTAAAIGEALRLPCAPYRG